MCRLLALTLAMLYMLLPYRQPHWERDSIGTHPTATRVRQVGTATSLHAQCTKNPDLQTIPDLLSFEAWCAAGCVDAQYIPKAVQHIQWQLHILMRNNSLSVDDNAPNSLE